MRKFKCWLFHRAFWGIVYIAVGFVNGKKEVRALWRCYKCLRQWETH